MNKNSVRRDPGRRVKGALCHTDGLGVCFVLSLGFSTDILSHSEDIAISDSEYTYNSSEI